MKWLRPIRDSNEMRRCLYRWHGALYTFSVWARVRLLRSHIPSIRAELCPKGRKVVANMATAHIEIAQGKREVDGRTGPRAAFDFFMAQRVHTAAATRAEIRSAGNKKSQFAAYCNLYGSQFG